MSEKILTISIAAYNVEDFLEETLSSFVCSEEIMNKLEIIVVNDGSKDNTLEIATKYALLYPGIYLAIDKENGGYGSTINAAVEVASGKYFRTVDGDDWVQTSELVNFVNYLEKCDADMVITKYAEVEDGTGETTIKGTEYPYRIGELTFDELPDGHVIQMHSATFKTKIFRDHQIKIREKCFYTDMEYNLKPVPYINSIALCDLVIYMYRTGREGQSVSLESWHRNIDMALQVSIGLAEFYEKVKKAGNIRDDQIRYIKNATVNSLQSKYRLLLTMPDKRSSKQKMVEFDKALYTCSPFLYKKCEQVNSYFYRYAIKFLRRSHFVMYRMSSCFYIWLKVHKMKEITR